VIIMLSDSEKVASLRQAKAYLDKMVQIRLDEALGLTAGPESGVHELHTLVTHALGVCRRVRIPMVHVATEPKAAYQMLGDSLD
jgi:hypothetical protein